MLSCLKVGGGNLECAGGHVELPLVLDLAVHLVILLGRWVKGITLRHFCYWHFFTRALLHAEKLLVGNEQAAIW